MAPTVEVERRGHVWTLRRDYSWLCSRCLHVEILHPRDVRHCCVGCEHRGQDENDDDRTQEEMQSKLEEKQDRFEKMQANNVRPRTARVIEKGKRLLEICQRDDERRGQWTRADRT